MSSHSLPAPTWILDYLRFDLLIGLQLLFLLVWVVLVSSIVSAQWASLILQVGGEWKRNSFIIVIIIVREPVSGTFHNALKTHLFLEALSAG